MPNTYTLIERISVGAAGASSITFTSIPQTYTDLKIVFSGRADAAQTPIIGAINGSTSNFTLRYLYGDGAGAYSANSTTSFFGNINPNNYTASTFSSTEIYIPNYTSSSAKSFSVDSTTENNATSSIMAMWSGLWNQTAAITSITITVNGGANFVQYSTAYLYGIAKQGVTPSLPSAPYATGGDSILFDGTYWYHTFTSTGTFTPKKGISCDVLIVAGGGSGGSRAGGGGGAGGVVYSSNQALTTTGYTVTVGAGGAAVVSMPSNRGNLGSNSSFTGLTAAVGGGGGGVYPGTTGYTATTGGSGGGGGSILGSTSGAGAAGTSGQGNAGGNGASNAYHGGGGGGAGAAGSNGNISQGGNGGVGTSTYSSWGSATATGQLVSGTYYYAGGGGGCANGSGGSGGGGNGSDGSSGNANAGTANTGGGGGGARNAPDTSNVYSGAGGSGIVIVRYAA
jgi:hypothetical protein